VRAIEAAGADLVRFDVMDNHHVPNLTIGPLMCEAICLHVRIPVDVHLMIEPVEGEGLRCIMQHLLEQATSK
jgi:ribulose-phosphate 3-epimerase